MRIGHHSSSALKQCSATVNLTQQEKSTGPNDEYQVRLEENKRGNSLEGEDGATSVVHLPSPTSKGRHEGSGRRGAGKEGPEEGQAERELRKR